MNRLVLINAQASCSAICLRDGFVLIVSLMSALGVLVGFASPAYRWAGATQEAA